MASPVLKPRLKLTVGNYLEGERVAEERHEFIDGISYEMAG